jgi:uncharacterized membrane protein
LSCLNKARSALVENSLLDEKGDLTDAEIAVMNAFRNQESIVTHPDEIEGPIGFGDRLSDRIASVGGSWAFILSFFVALILWIILNTLVMQTGAFDPYPYILLNLVLSCIAAFQAPVIMMSQNRQALKDRMQAEADYKTNLKAELEIRHLHVKIDQLISHQWRKLLDIQQVQLDMMQDFQKINDSGSKHDP